VYILLKGLFFIHFKNDKMNPDNQIPENILELIIKREKDGLSNDQKTALETFQKQHPELKKEFQAYALITRQSRLLGIRKQIDKEKAWKKIAGEAHRERPGRFVIRQWMKYAAVLLPMLLIIGFFYIRLAQQKEEIALYSDIMSTVRQDKARLILGTGEELILESSTVGQIIEREGVSIHKESKERISYTAASVSTRHSLVVPRGGEYQLVLPDGSIAYINSGSRLDFPTIFDGDIREVTLSGEAYFEVIHDPERPFIVNSPDFRVTVTGTAFNVYNYPDDVAETTLVNGRVMVSSDNHDHVSLKPGQQAIIKADADRMDIRDVDTDLYTSWVYGLFRFKDMKLSDLARRMERWYDVEIVFADDAAGELRLTGAMEKEKAFESLVWLIEKSTNVSFDIADNHVIVNLQQ
jgi:transmembrane sensor